eukprot:jgi/Picsp_1/589/NSC_00586-R1_prt1 protein
MNDLSDAEAWKCAICQELLYKPVANVCGHLFCFWCAHKAMSPFSSSKCPLCRTQYGHFPAMVSKLHAFLRASFPDLYAIRAAEVLEEEELRDIESPEIPNSYQCYSRPGHPSPKDFACDNCNELVFMPVILNCGHVVCRAPCRGHGNDSCPCCDGLPVADHSIVCNNLWELMKKAFPRECAAREKQVIESGVDVDALLCSPRETVSQSRPEDDGSAGDQSISGTNQDEEMSPWGEHVSNGTVPLTTNGIISWLQRNDYPHFGVGCDACGQYPILGRRYRCKDCPEAVGFDICGSCHDRGVGSIVGRFNQKHSPEHVLELVSPIMTKLHILKAMHPELDFDRLLALIEMSWEDEEAAQPNPQQGATAATISPQEEAHESDIDPMSQEQITLQDENAEEVAPMMRARGPRPAFDHQAEWPSPGSTAAGSSAPRNCD